MCNLYSYTRAQAEAIALARALRDKAGNLPPLPAIFPDHFAPVVRTGDDGVCELVRLRWGMPTPPAFLKGEIDRGVTNIRNTKSAHWRRWLTPQYRCLVPATSFCEPTDAPNPVTKRKDWVWFALSPERPVFFFAGIWGKWNGARGTKANPATGEHELFGFLTTDPNGDVSQVHTKAMPVILTEPDQLEAWMTRPIAEAIQLQQPLSDGILSIVARGSEKQDRSMTKTRQQEISEKFTEQWQRSRDWLVPFMQNNQPKFLTKDELRSAAMRELNVSKSAFDFGWMAAIEDTGRHDWYEPLRRRLLTKR